MLMFRRRHFWLRFSIREHPPSPPQVSIYMGRKTRKNGEMLSSGEKKGKEGKEIAIRSERESV